MRGRALRVAVGTPVLALLAIAGMAGCSAGGGRGASALPTRCGTTRTAAGVPVEIEIAHGGAPCAVALSVERAYARAIASGRVAGNGGGAPTKVRGWVCQGFNTPEVLSTGDASSCRRAGTEILAVLPDPASPTPSA